jgi:hypothetical protein
MRKGRTLKKIITINKILKYFFMATEIFIEPELENLQDETTAAEWFELCSQLGLDNQLSLADKSTDKKAPPYMFLDEKTKRIIKTLCPVVVKYEEYKSSTIPLDVLKEIKKAKENGWYMRIDIAYDDQSPDPFVIGACHADHIWNAPRHLIARWGAELLPFEQLEAKAIARLRDSASEALNTMKHDVEFGIQNIDSFIRRSLAGNQLPIINFRVDSLSW